MEHILLVLDPARQEGKLVEKAIQMDLIVDVVQIRLPFFVLLSTI